MKIRFLLFILFCLVIKHSFSQVTFQKTFGDQYNDFGRQALALPGGNYAILGSLNSKVYLIKTDSLGKTLWAKTYSPSYATFYQQGNISFQATKDGGFIIACGIPGTFSYIYPKICLMKITGTGTISWTKYLTSPRENGNYGTWAYEVINTIDSGYAIVGTEAASTDYNVFLIKTDSSGTIKWSKSYGRTGDDEGYSVKQNALGQYIIAGYCDAVKYGNRDIFLVKTDSTGKMIWNKRFGGTHQDYATHVEITKEGSYILTGVAAGFGTNINGDDMFLMKTDTAGKILWSNIYSGTVKQAGTSVKQTSDAGFIAAGYTSSFGAGGKDVYLVKTDSSGTVKWSRTYGGVLDDEGIDVIQQKDGYVITGMTRNFSKGQMDIYFIKTDSLGRAPCKQDTARTIAKTVTLTVDTGCVVASGYLPATVNMSATNDDTTGYNVCVCRTPHAEFFWAANHSCVGFNDFSTWANKWHWDFGDGKTDTTQNPNHCYPGGNYKVCLTVQNECGSNTYCDSVLNIPIGINELYANNNLVIYPNPAQNKFTVAFNTTNTSINHIFLTDLTGRLILEKSFHSIAGENKVEIDVSTVAKGIYLLTVTGEKGEMRGRIVVE